MLFSREILYFRASYIHRSFRKAGDAINLSASSVNRHVNKLEAKLGTQLFVRSPGGLFPTPSATRLFQYSEQAINDLDVVLSEITPDLGNQIDIPLLGPQSLVQEIIVPSLQEEKSARRKFRISVKTRPDQTDYLRYHSEMADIILGFDLIAPANSPVEVVFQQTFAIGAILPADHPLADKKPISIEECLAHSCIFPDNTWPLRHKLDALLPENNDGGPIGTTNSIEYLRSEILDNARIGFATITPFIKELKRGDMMHRAILPGRANPEAKIDQYVCIAALPAKQTAAHREVISKLTQRIKILAEFDRELRR